MRAEEFSLSIKFADDSTLLTLDFDKLQVATLELQQSCLKWGMKINFDKCKVLTPSSVPDTTKDIERRIALALTAFGRQIHLVKQRHLVKIEIKTLPILDTTNCYLCFRNLGSNKYR